jgi:hypothetical protein
MLIMLAGQDLRPEITAYGSDLICFKSFEKFFGRQIQPPACP